MTDQVTLLSGPVTNLNTHTKNTNTDEQQLSFLKNVLDK